MTARARTTAPPSRATTPPTAWSVRAAAAGVEAVEGVDHQAVAHGLDPRCRRGDVLDVDERAPGRQEVEDLGVEGALAGMRKVVNGVARHHGVERRAPVDRAPPVRAGEVGTGDQRCGPAIAEGAARRLEHRLGHVHEGGLGVGVALEERAGQHAAAAAEVGEAPHRAGRGADHAQHDVDLIGGVGHAAADLLDERAHEVAALPDAVVGAHRTSPPGDRRRVRRGGRRDAPVVRLASRAGPATRRWSS
jgi:hypothetical protein